MRIVLLNTSDIQGGAARAAYRLHRGLLAAGEQSHMLVQHKISTDETVSQAVPERDRATARRSRQLHWIHRYGVESERTTISNTFFSLPEPGFDLSSNPLVAQADILHLHWVAGLLSPRAVASLQALGKPIIWTLHDQRPFTGGCHYSAGCRKYETDCAGCPQLSRNEFDLTRASLADAAELIRAGDIHVVCPSRWLADCARRSALFRQSRVAVIPNGIDTNVFCPQDRASVRQKLGLRPGAVYFLFGADSWGERRKGSDFLCEALRLCLAEPWFREAVAAQSTGLLCFGDAPRHLTDLDLPIRFLGRLDNEEAIASLYAAADVFLLPSQEDNLPNTVLEAMSCGTPVLAQRIGGVPDMVTDGVTGFLAPLGDVKKFAEALMALAQGRELRQNFGEQCRRDILQRFIVEKQARNCIELYQELLAQKTSSASPAPLHTPRALSMADWGPHWSMIFPPLLREARRLRRTLRGSLFQRLQRELKRLLQRWHGLKAKILPGLDQANTPP